ncbi:MAG: hypothetical protein GY851_02275 [bacterium]|nr:hypothetical protein [bacterium]
MDLDAFREAWQGQETEGPSGEEVVRMVERKHRKLERTVVWRDVRESVAALVLAAFFVVAGHHLARHMWPWYGAAGCCLWVAAFLIVDRRIQRDGQPAASTREALDRALRQVDHQIRLLRNVFWWYLLPCLGAIALVLGEMMSQISRESWGTAYAPFLFTVVLVAVLYPAIYWMNQHAVKHQLLPHKQELAEALHGLQEEE